MEITINLSEVSKTLRLYIAREVADKKALAELAKDAYGDVRLAVARNKNASSETLAELAKCDGWDLLKMSVAANESTPSEILSLLAKDNDSDVRKAVATNKNTSAEILSLFVEDYNRKVKLIAQSRIITTKKNWQNVVLKFNWFPNLS